MTGAWIRRLVWNVVPVGIVLGIVGLTLFGQDGLLERHTLKQRLLRAESQVQSIQDENADLRVEIHRLRTSRAAQERAAAETLLVAPEGATVYRFE